MPPRRRPAAAESLTPDDLIALAAAVADGRRATVYLREGTPSLNLAPGTSARVVSVSGNTVLIRPRGVDDELPFEADELRMTKNAPPQPEPKAKAAKAGTATAGGRAPRPTTAPKTPAATTVRGRTFDAPAPKPPAAKPATPKADTPAFTPKPATPKPARRGPAKKATASVTVTLYGSSDNEWAVSVTRGGRKPNRSRSVPVEAVETAVRDLGDEPTVDAVTALMHAAREEAQRRVEELSAQLAAAREALAALE